MADCIRYVCDTCGMAIEAWSDGNPYYIDELGKKRYAYHPDHLRLAMCIGNDTPHLCLGCGKQFMVDSRKPVNKCPACGYAKIMDTYQLEGYTCPTCKSGQFYRDKDFYCIS